MINSETIDKIKSKNEIARQNMRAKNEITTSPEKDWWFEDLIGQFDQMAREAIHQSLVLLAHRCQLIARDHYM